MTDCTLLLLRHAESAPDESLPEPDWPLSARGERQAIALADAHLLRGATRIVSSPFRRTQATVAPLAHRLGSL